MTRRNCLWAVAILLMGLAARARGAEAVNLVANGDFAAVAGGGRPEKWAAYGDAKAVTQTLTVEREADGRRFARLACTRFESEAPSAHAMLAQVGVVKLVRGRTYEFSCRVRGQGPASLAVSVSVAVSDTRTWENCGLQAQLTATTQWKAHRRVFKATRDVGETSRLQLWFHEPATFDVADVRLVEIEAGAAQFTDLAPAPAAGAVNLIPDASFEAGAGGWTSLGQGAGWGDLHRLHGTVELAGDAPHGNAFLRIPLGGERTPVLAFDYYEPVVRRELRPLAAHRGWVRVEPGVAYTLSASLRASRAGVPALLGLRTADPADGGRGTQDRLTPVTLTTEWKRYTTVIRPAHRFAFVCVGPNLAQEETAHVDVDAVQLEKAEAATEFAPAAPVEVSVEPGVPGGVFTDDAPASLVIRAANHAGAAARVTVKLSATDFEDRAVALPDVEVALDAKSTGRHVVTLPADWRGYYRVGFSAAAGPVHPSQVRVAIVPARRAGEETVCGVNHAFVNDELIRLAAKAGVSWYRDWSLRWQTVEATKGTFVWDKPDAQIDRVRRTGARVLPLLPPFPSADWASEAPASLPTRGYPGARLRQAWGPKDPADLAHFVGRAVGRYKDRATVWHFLNEPIYTDYALPADAGNKYGGRRYAPGDYVALLKTAAAAMRAADPRCTVLGGIGAGPLRLTREIIDAGILEHIDALDLHIYPGARPPEAYADEMARLLAMMDARGKRVPLWVTEFSYYGADDLPRRPFIPGENSWAEPRLLDDERQCADYTTRFFLVMLSHGAQRVFIHSGSSGRANEPNLESALLADQAAPRKLFPALAVLTHLLGPAPRAAGYRATKGMHAAAFETEGGALVAVWRTGDAPGAAPRTLPAGPEVTWVNAMGQRLPGPPAALSSSPVYVRGPAGKAAALLAALVNGAATMPR